MNDEGEAPAHLDHRDAGQPDGSAPARPALDQIEAALDDVAATLAQMD